MPADKYIELLIRYKNQITICACLVVSVLCFVGGRYSVEIPPKSVICAEEIKTADKLFSQIEEERNKHITEIRSVHDEEQKECKKRVIEEVEKFKDDKPSLDCRICKALSVQCKKKGLW